MSKHVGILRWKNQGCSSWKPNLCSCSSQVGRENTGPLRSADRQGERPDLGEEATMLPTPLHRVQGLARHHLISTDIARQIVDFVDTQSHVCCDSRGPCHHTSSSSYSSF